MKTNFVELVLNVARMLDNVGCGFDEVSRDAQVELGELAMDELFHIEGAFENECDNDDLRYQFEDMRDDIEDEWRIAQRGDLTTYDMEFVIDKVDKLAEWLTDIE